MSYGHKDDKNSIDVDIKQDMSVEVDTKTTSDRTSSDTSTSTRTDNINVNVHSPKFSYVNVDIKEEVTRNETTTRDTTYTENTNIKFTENVVKDIDVDLSSWDVEVDVKASNIIQNASVTTYNDSDVNDVDTSDLINVASGGTLNIDDFNLDQLAIGGSFNGDGNDLQLSLSQSNDLTDNDNVHGTTVGYANHQYPNVSGELDYEHAAKGSVAGGYAAKSDSKEYYQQYSTKHGSIREGVVYSDSAGAGWFGASAAVYDSLSVSIDVEAPDTAFQTVSADGGEATSGDGIGDAKVTDSAKGNEGDGAVAGDTTAVADAVANADAFTIDIDAGSNQQANLVNLTIVGGNELDAGDVAELGGYTGDDDDRGSGHGGHGGDAGGTAIRDATVLTSNDDDVNDLDTSNLIDVYGNLNMDDFDLNTVAIGDSFNGPGNDMQFDVNQVNDLVDNDAVTGTSAYYVGGGWNGAFQDVSATGGSSEAGSGVGSLTASGSGNDNGGDGSFTGSAAASASASASAEAFTVNIVVGANLQVNSFTASIVGGDSSLVDDIG